jgi:alkylhydroperoxidase family enzyme
VDNIMQIHALNPDGMKAHSALYQSAMSGTKTLRKVDREMIALIVSDANECHY